MKASVLSRLFDNLYTRKDLMRAFAVSSFTSLFIVTSLYTENANTLDRSIREVQDAIYRLDYSTAERISGQIISENPDSPLGHGMLSITRWNKLLFAASNLALDDYATPTPFTKGRTSKPIDRETEEFHQANDDLLAVCQRLLQKDSKDVLALYFKGLAYENLSGEAIVITKSRGAAFTYGRRAKNVHEQVLGIDPDFVDANVSIAGNEFAKATLPWNIKWIAFLLGIRGSKEKAFERLELVAERGKYRELDALLILALLHSWKGDPQRPVMIFEKLREKYPQNYLFDINLAAMYGLKLKDGLSALRIYQQLLKSLPDKASGLHPGEIYFRIGKTYRVLREYRLALEAFQNALHASQGERETAPLSYFHMAQIHDERGEKELAIEYYRQVLDHTQSRGILSDEMKQAGNRLNRLEK